MTKILEAFTKLGQPGVKFAATRAMWAMRAMPVILPGLLLFIGYSNINFYFHEYRFGHYYENPKDEISYETRIYTAPLGTQGRMFLIANPDVPYLTFKSFDYFAPGMQKIRLNHITLETLLNLPYDKDALFIALPGYESDLEFIAMIIPGGEWHEVKRRYQSHEMLFYSYKITKEQLAVFTGFVHGYDMLDP